MPLTQDDLALLRERVRMFDEAVRDEAWPYAAGCADSIIRFDLSRLIEEIERLRGWAGAGSQAR